MNRSSDGFYPAMDPTMNESTTLSGVSWGAIFAGAAAAAALSMILVLLGFGLGFSAVSPWAGEGVSAKGLGMTLVFNLVTHLLQGDVSLHNTDTGCVVTLICPLNLSTTT